MQYYSHEPHCKEEIFNLGTNLWSLKTTHFYFYFHIKHIKVKVKLHGGNKIPPTHNVKKLTLKTEIMIGLHRVVQNIFPSIPKGLYQAVLFLWEDCSSFLQ